MSPDILALQVKYIKAYKHLKSILLMLKKK